MKPSRVCITGAGGFVGSALAEGFAALGWQVTGLDLAFDEATRARLAAATLVTVDVARGLPADTPAADVLVHAAALTTSPDDLGWTAAAYIDANMRPLLATLEHAARTRPAAFVFLSSSGVFDPGDGTTDGLRDTDVPTASSPYAAAKRAGELLVAAALDTIGAAHVVRLGYVYGPHEVARASRTRVSLVARWLADARAGRPLIVRADNPRRDWTFAGDLAPALARLTAGPATGQPLHLCGPHVVSDAEMARLVAEQVSAAVVSETSPAAATKPPMRPSPLACLKDLSWTTPRDGIARLAAMEVAA